MKLLSKIYKSASIFIGSPKHVVNDFNEEMLNSGEDAARVKRSDFPEPGDDANAIIEDAKQMYLNIIEEANTEAKKILEAAYGEAQRLASASMEDGYKEGFENGYLAGKEEAQSIIDEASATREFLDVRRENLYKEAEENILTLIMDIARKIIGEEFSYNEEALLILINNALQKCAFKESLVLKVSPDDIDFALKNKNNICMMVEGLSDIDIVPDLSLSKGSCIIETPSGDINSGIDIQMSEIKRIFTYLLRNE